MKRTFEKILFTMTFFTVGFACCSKSSSGNVSGEGNVRREKIVSSENASSSGTISARGGVEDTEILRKIEKLDSVLEKMSPRFKSKVQIGDKKEFLADLEKVLASEADFSADDLSPFFLIDKKNFVGEDYVPKNLVHLEKNDLYNITKNSLNLRPEAFDALKTLSQAAKNDGVTLTVGSTYRSYEYQKNLFDYWVRVDGLEEAERESARPGTSQHQLGLALDFSPIDDDFAETEAGRWVYKNAAKYGWSLSFPKNYEDVTGYRWESWHFRYIGTEAVRFQEKYFDDVQQFMIEFIDGWKKN